MHMKPRVLKVSAILLAIAIGSMYSILAVPAEVGSSSYRPTHSSISIDGNENFTAANGVTGGSGTPSDPYIIEEWEIDASVADGIRIRNTDASFVVRNVYVHSGKFHTGIFLNAVTNGRLENTTLSTNWKGILTWFSANITIAGSRIFANEAQGIEFVSSTRIVLEDNEVSSNRGTGIVLLRSDRITAMRNTISNNGVGLGFLESTNSTITGNSLVANGIDIGGESLPHFSSHLISSDNVVNGKPVYYNKNCNDLDVDGVSIGQLIVVNCTKVRAANLQIANTDWGIQMAFVDEGVITDNGLYDNAIGLLLSFTANVSILTNDLGSNASASGSSLQPGPRSDTTTSRIAQSWVSGWAAPMPSAWTTITSWITAPTTAF